MPLVDEYGEMWAKNKANINFIRKSKSNGMGVYVLYDGIMPVYIGKGNIGRRIRSHKRSKKRGQFWDYFSWYIISDTRLCHDIEVLLLRRLPWYLRGLNRQSGKFQKAKQIREKDIRPESIRRKLHRN